MGSKSCAQANILFAIFIIYLFKHDDGNISIRQTKFEVIKNSSNENVCSTDNPNQVINKVRSKVECILWCFSTPGCHDANWKEPNTCEIYLHFPSAYGIQTGCTYYLQGNIYHVFDSEQIEQFVQTCVLTFDE